MAQDNDDDGTTTWEDIENPVTVAYTIGKGMPARLVISRNDWLLKNFDCRAQIVSANGQTLPPGDLQNFFRMGTWREIPLEEIGQEPVDFWTYGPTPRGGNSTHTVLLDRKYNRVKTVSKATHFKAEEWLGSDRLATHYGVING